LYLNGSAIVIVKLFATINGLLTGKSSITMLAAPVALTRTQLKNNGVAG
jgi:hypothetical protein